MIDMNKKYKTRSGLPVRILCVDRVGFNPVVYLLMEDGGESIVSSTIDGRFGFLGQLNDLDLIEITPYEEFKIDEPVMVRDFDTEPWNRRHFAGVDEHGRAKAWDECRRPTPDEVKPV